MTRPAWSTWGTSARLNSPKLGRIAKSIRNRGGVGRERFPDSFVREFGQWCAEQGVRGKYSIVPYPACVGWLDRELPGWSRRELQESLKLVRELMVPNWDIHPEMITHTRVIDLKTGRPMCSHQRRDDGELLPAGKEERR